MNWHLAETLRQRCLRERGAQITAPGARAGFALVFPNEYHLGMANLGFQIIYREINRRTDTACERAFLPSAVERAEYRRTGTALMTVETRRPLCEFPLVGFAVSFELDYFNVLEILQLGRIPLCCEERGEADPVVIAGGPCATFNPQPLTPFIDVFVVGEGEEVVQELLDAYHAGLSERISRQELLKRLSLISGLYVPAYHRPGTRVRRRWIDGLDRFAGETAIVADATEFDAMYLVEVARGCGRHCRFCMAGYCFRPPRSRSVDRIRQGVLNAARMGRKVGLVGAAVSDFPDMDLLCEMLRTESTGTSVASLRADSTTTELVQVLAASGHRTITLAPEAGSERLRRVINKGISEDALLRTVAMALEAGIPNVKLYIMIGLPEETDGDIAEIRDLALKTLRCMREHGPAGTLTLSVNPFVPKPFTPFQWLPMADRTIIAARLKKLEQSLKSEKKIRVQAESLREAYLQAVLARGDRRIGEVLLQAHRLGGRKAWNQAMKAAGIPEEQYLYREYPEDAELPWEVADVGVSREYLWSELQKARRLFPTAPCAAGCRRCGVCREEVEKNGQDGEPSIHGS